MNKKFAQPIRNITFVLIAVGLIAIALGGFLTPVSRIILSPFIAAQTWISERFQALQGFITTPRDVAELRQRNVELETEISRLQTQIIELQQQLTEYQVLSTLLDFARARPEYRYVGATVIGRDPSPFLKYVIINRGSDDDLQRGMPVVTQQGLVGRVASVTANGAQVQLITDPASSINVQMQPSDAEAMLVGSITGDIILELIPQEALIQAGDLVLTSGLGGKYPPNLLVGQVTGVRKQDYALFQSASVQPVVDFSRLEIVLVITNFQPVDISPFSPLEAAPQP